jgi:dynein heavy chain
MLSACAAGAQDCRALSACAYSDTNSKLARKIEDLEDVRNVMNVLKEVREKESEIDNLIGPIEEMYGLLMRYEVRVPKEETTMVSDLRWGWKKLKKVRPAAALGLERGKVMRATGSGVLQATLPGV